MRVSVEAHAALRSHDEFLNGLDDDVDTTDAWEIRLLYDGECPICTAEADFLRSRDKAGKIQYVDISDPDYSPEQNAGIEFETAMGHIHGITRDGRIVKGVECLQMLYNTVGLGWLFAVT